MLIKKEISGVQSFENELNAASTNTIVLKFGSVRCGPCGMLDEELEKYNDNDDITLFSISMDDRANRELEHAKDIMVVPTLKIVDKKSNVIKEDTGFMTIDKFISFAKQ